MIWKRLSKCHLYLSALSDQRNYGWKQSYVLTLNRGLLKGFLSNRNATKIIWKGDICCISHYWKVHLLYPFLVPLTSFKRYLKKLYQVKSNYLEQSRTFGTSQFKYSTLLLSVSAPSQSYFKNDRNKHIQDHSTYTKADIFCWWLLNNRDVCFRFSKSW